MPKKLLEKISKVVNHDKFIYQICSKIDNIVLIDDESDWEIFKELAKIKVGDSVLEILDKIIPIKITSSYNSDFQLFGNEKIEFVKQIKNYTTNNSIKLKNIFMICDLDEYPIINVESDHRCKNVPKLKPYLDEIKEFNNGQTKSFLLSWKRREILHYTISYTMIKEYSKLDELKIIADYINNDNYIGKNFDSDNNVKTAKKDYVKFIKLLMSKDSGDVDEDNWTDYAKLKEVIGKIPQNEISQDIENMYNFIKNKVLNS